MNKGVREPDARTEPSAPTGEDEPKQKRQLVLHPLLFAAFPVLYLYAHNIQEGVSGGDLLRSLVLVIGATAILFALAFLRSEEHTSELQSHHDLVCRLL